MSGGSKDPVVASRPRAQPVKGHSPKGHSQRSGGLDEPRVHVHGGELPQRAGTTDDPIDIPGAAIHADEPQTNPISSNSTTDGNNNRQHDDNNMRLGGDNAPVENPAHATEGGAEIPGMSRSEMRELLRLQTKLAAMRTCWANHRQNLSRRIQSRF